MTNTNLFQAFNTNTIPGLHNCNTIPYQYQCITKYPNLEILRDRGSRENLMQSIMSFLHNIGYCSSIAHFPQQYCNTRASLLYCNTNLQDLFIFDKNIPASTLKPHDDHIIIQAYQCNYNVCYLLFTCACLVTLRRLFTPHLISVNNLFSLHIS